MRLRVTGLLVGLLALLWPATGRAADEGAEPLVYAAVSLTDVLQQVGADYARERGAMVKFSFGSTATLARQIEAGARADLFISADQDWMDYVDQRGLIRKTSRMDLLGNRLVLVAPADSRVSFPIGRGMPIRDALGARGRLALADPASVPAGKYAKAALTSLGAWGEVEGRIVAAENVRMALLFVARGEAPLGVVYATDARAEPKVRVVGEFPVGSHAPIVYPVALTSGARSTAAPFLQYLTAGAARVRFEAAGFTVAPGGADPAIACRVNGWDMSAEVALFQGNAEPLTAANAPGRSVPALQPGRLYTLALAPQSTVTYPATPSRNLLADGSFAGLAQFSVPRAGRYRITVDGPFWIDVVRQRETLRSLEFGGRQECPLFRKSVEYDLPAGEALTLQLGGAARGRVRVAVVPSGPAGPGAAP